MSTTILPEPAPRGTNESVPLAGRLAWHESAPAAVAGAESWDDDSPGWRAWADHLRTRKKPAAVDIFAAKRSPLRWAVTPDISDCDVEDSESLRLIASLHKLKPRDGEWAHTALHAWLAETDGAETAVGHHAAMYALECLAWCHALPKLAGMLGAAAWWKLLGKLLNAATAAAAIDLSEHPLTRMLLAGELPLTLSWLLGEIEPCRAQGDAARAAMSADMRELLDGQGLPRAAHLPVFRPLVACWTRCQAIGDELDEGCWDADAETQFSWSVRNLLRLTRPDGGQMLASPHESLGAKRLLEAAVEFGGDDEDEAIFDVMTGRSRASQTKRHSGCADHSEWSSIAVLRCGWKRNSPALAVAYPGASLTAELCCGEPLLAGDVAPRVQFNGQPAEPSGGWECVCWESDDDVDYLELEIDLAGGLRVQRQMLLARDDHFLLLADAVLAPRPGQIEVTHPFPFAGDAFFQPEEETREGVIAGAKKAKALVIPLALNEWALDRSGGSLTGEGHEIQLRQHGQGSALFAPLFFDLKPRRFQGLRVTWRRLTVAEDRRIVTPDAAAGYRVQVGREQWAIYRSLTPKTSRTLLGINVNNEFAVWRFRKNGEVEALLEIE